MFKNEPDLLTRKQCQDLLHISKSKMLDLIHKDLIPAHIIAGSFRIEKADLIDFVQKFPLLEIRIIKNSQKIPRHFIFFSFIQANFSHAKNLSAIDFPI